MRDSNPRPPPCKGGALPTELIPQQKEGQAEMVQEGWAWVESNYRPHAYQACALTN